jgi:hypothetical protein
MNGHCSHTGTEFLWIRKQNKMYVLFLPAHPPHVLQPRKMGIFASPKSHYRSEMAKLASSDVVSPVKKQRFITCYKLAQKETFTLRLLREGWIAAESIDIKAP